VALNRDQKIAWRAGEGVVVIRKSRVAQITCCDSSRDGVAAHRPGRVWIGRLRADSNVQHKQQREHEEQFLSEKVGTNRCHITPQSISDLGYPSPMKLGFTLVLLLLTSLPAFAQSWTVKLDKDIRFYQTTEMGIVIAGTEKSLYAIDGESGQILWRRKDTSLDETDVAPVPGTDLLLLSFEKGDKARIEAVDILTGDPIWRSEKIKG